MHFQWEPGPWTYRQADTVYFDTSPNPQRNFTSLGPYLHPLADHISMPHSRSQLSVSASNNLTRIHIRGIKSSLTQGLGGRLNKRMRINIMTMLINFTTFMIYISISVLEDYLSAPEQLTVLASMLKLIKETINLNHTPTNLSI